MHVDFDAFYASVEACQNPTLRGRPLIIGADPKEGKGRGVVVSCSYEARKYGVRSAMPISQAYKLCPDATYLRPNFPLYEQVSDRLMTLLRGFSERFEQAGLDEAFLDVTDKVGSYEEAERLGHRIKDVVFENEGLTCSIGVASSKATAKIASDHQKPAGLTVVKREETEEFLSPLPVSAIAGVGKKTSHFLKSKGIKTVRQLQDTPKGILLEWFGRPGLWLWMVAHGIDESEVKERKIKSLSTEQTFEQDISKRTVALEAIEKLSEELAMRAQEANLHFRSVGIKIRFKGFETHTRETTIPNPSNSRATIVKYANALFEEFKDDSREIRLIGIRVSRLSSAEAQVSLEKWVTKIR